MEKLILEKTYNQIKTLIDHALCALNIHYTISNNAPNTYRDMVNFRDNNGYFSVYDGGDHSFFGKEYNIKFRALHDYLHYTYNLKFNATDEIKVRKKTYELFYDMAKYTLSSKELNYIDQVLRLEIDEQIKYYNKNKEYVVDQKDFILNQFKV